MTPHGWESVRGADKIGPRDALFLEDAALSRPPFVLAWDNQTNPLPVRAIRETGRQPRPGPELDPPAWLPTGPPDQPFPFCHCMSLLCADIAARCEALRHIDTTRLLFGMTQARNGRVHGLQARVTPLRFRNGKLSRLRRGVEYRVQRFIVNGREMLYLVTFCLPRFLDQDFDQKLITVFHELYHISSAFDGDLRRHDGRYTVHSHSQRRYDEHMAHLARGYLRDGANPELHAFLRLDFGQLQRRHGSIHGIILPRPKLLPVLTG